jgi:hypothetical protein
MQGREIPIDRRRGGAGLVVYNDKFYVVGGNTLGHAGGAVSWLDSYDPVTNEWMMLPSAVHPRDHFAAAIVDGRLYAAAGRASSTDNGNVFDDTVNDIEVYDITSSTWSIIGTMENHVPRAAASIAYINGQILVIGGENPDGVYERVDAIDPVTGNVTQLAPMNYKRHGTQAIRSGDGVYILAGSDQKGGGRQKNMEVYNLDSAAGEPSVGCVLSGPVDAVFAASVPATVDIVHSSGNTGGFVTDVSLTGVDAADFSLIGVGPVPFLLPVAGNFSFKVSYNGEFAGAVAQVRLLA